MKGARSRISKAMLAALLMTGVVGSQALANNDGVFLVDGVNIRTDPYLTATVIGLGYTDQHTCLFQMVTGDYANGNPYWWQHHRPPTSTGYSHVSYLGDYGPISCS